MGKYYVLTAIRKDNTVSKVTGDWLYEPEDYKIECGELVQKDRLPSGTRYTVNVNGRLFYYDDIFETREDAERRKKELLKLSGHII